MYNRYFPNADGTYQKESRQDTPAPEKEVTVPPEVPMWVCTEGKQKPPVPSSSLFPFLGNSLDSGDLLTIFIMLVIASDKPENRNCAILTLIFYFLL